MTRKIILLLISIVALTTCGIPLSAESVTDPTGDVYHWRNTGSMMGWDTNIGTKPNIDITDITYSVNGQQVTVTMTIAGTIVNSELVSYFSYLNTSDSSYWLSWNDNQGFGFGTNTEDGSFDMDYDPEITSNGNTISATYDVIGTFSSDIEVWGWAVEYTTYGDMNAEFWADWAPESYAWYDGDDESGDEGSNTEDSNDSDTTENEEKDKESEDSTGTPGFEIIILFIGIALVVFALRKRS